ncbi:hypothetical protein NG783_10450 [Aliarcobacter cryaerophilus]|uniref:hypothetical protein n=1 Tax=Aliarcobacter cryaerophilus TaxID=28198 RepID=UPI003DA1CCB1
MIIDDLIEVKKSLETTYKDFSKLKTYTILKLVKKIIIEYKDDLSQKEILKFINDVFNVKIEYQNFNKFFISFCREKNKSKKELKNEDVKIIKASKNCELNEASKIDVDIISKKKIDDNSKSGVRVNLPKIENVNVGLIESKNRDRIK